MFQQDRRMPRRLLAAYRLQLLLERYWVVCARLAGGRLGSRAAGGLAGYAEGGRRRASKARPRCGRLAMRRPLSVRSARPPDASPPAYVDYLFIIDVGNVAKISSQVY